LPGGCLTAAALRSLKTGYCMES